MGVFLLVHKLGGIARSFVRIILRACLAIKDIIEVNIFFNNLREERKMVCIII